MIVLREWAMGSYFLPPEMLQIISRVIKGRILMMGILLFCLLPFLLVMPVLWSASGIGWGFAGGFTTVVVLSAAYVMCGLFFNVALYKKRNNLPLKEISGMATKWVRHFRIPIEAGGATYLTNNTIKASQGFKLGGKLYIVPVFMEFDSFMEEIPVKISYIEMGGPFFKSFRRLVVSWEQ